MLGVKCERHRRLAPVADLRVRRAHPFVKIHIIKLLVFIALLACFYFSGGFERPFISQDDYRSLGRMTKAWLLTLAMFFAGAALSVYGNDIAELVDWDIPQGLYPAIGVCLLIGGFIWMLMLKDSVHSARALNKSLEPTAGTAVVLCSASTIMSLVIPGCGSAFVRYASLSV